MAASMTTAGRYADALALGNECLAPKRQAPKRSTRNSAWLLARSVFLLARVAIQHAAPWLPWLFCLVGLSTGPAGRGYMKEQKVILGLGLSSLAASAASAAASPRGPFASGSSAVLGMSGGRYWLGLATFACILVHLGFTTPELLPEDDLPPLALPPCSPSHPSCSSITSHGASAVATVALADYAVSTRKAVLGLSLLDDILRCLTRFLGGPPEDVWPFALTNRRSYFLWANDEDWWEACYRSTLWMKLPAHPGHLSRRHLFGSGQRCLLSEALLLACVAVEAMGTLVVLPPHCVASCWVMAPLVASTLLIIAHCPPLPRHPQFILLSILNLLRLTSKIAVYFQAVWLLVGNMPFQEQLGALHSDEDDHDDHFGAAGPVLEIIAVSALFAALAGRLWVVAAWCRAALPLYAVPIEEMMWPGSPSSAASGRPLFCSGSSPHSGADRGGGAYAPVGVGGSHAPTHMCDWEDLGVDVAWRDKLSLRRRAETLTAREAYLLSFLDALDLRITEAEVELQGGARRRWFVDTVAGAAAVFATGFFALVTWRWRLLGCRRSGGIMEAAFWVSLALRAGRCRQSVVELLSTFCGAASFWQQAACAERERLPQFGPDTHTATSPGEEVSVLRRHARALHVDLAETQRSLWHLEAQLQAMGVALRRPASSAALTHMPMLTLRTLLVFWAGTVVAISFSSVRGGP